MGIGLWEALRKGRASAKPCFALLQAVGMGLRQQRERSGHGLGGASASQIPAGILGRAGTFLGSLGQVRSQTLPIGPAACGYWVEHCPSLHPCIPVPKQCGCGSRFPKEGIYWVENQQKSLVCRNVAEPWEGRRGCCVPLGSSIRSIPTSVHRRHGWTVDCDCIPYRSISTWKSMLL